MRVYLFEDDCERDVGEATTITVIYASVKYPSSEYDVLWVFDQKSNHTVKGRDALNAHRVNVNPGGLHTPIMRDTE